MFNILYALTVLNFQYMKKDFSPCYYEISYPHVSSGQPTFASLSYPFGIIIFLYYDYYFYFFGNTHL